MERMWLVWSPCICLLLRLQIVPQPSFINCYLEKVLYAWRFSSCYRGIPVVTRPRRTPISHRLPSLLGLLQNKSKTNHGYITTYYIHHTWLNFQSKANALYIYINTYCVYICISLQIYSYYIFKFDCIVEEKQETSLQHTLELHKSWRFNTFYYYSQMCKTTIIKDE